MDKLKDILKYKFWILLGLAVLIPLIGWAVARSSLVAEASARTQTLTDLQKKLVATTADPNTDWEAKIKQQNARQEVEKRRAWEVMYERQKALMTWPEDVDPEKVPIEIQDREVYRTSYRRERKSVYLAADPIDPLTGTGKVRFDEGAMPDHFAWENNAPTAEEVFAAQEDLWLLRALLERIAAVNKDANSQVDAPVRVLYEIKLRGGSLATGGAAPAAAGGMMGDLGMGGFGFDEFGNESMGGIGGGGGYGPAQAGDGAFSASVTFDPNDELGPEVQVASADQTADPSAAPGPGAAPGMPAALKYDRYVDKKPEWKTRGFYLEVAMDHRRLPELLAALTNARWPVRIARVQQADFRDEDLVQESPFMPGMPGVPGAPGAMPFNTAAADAAAARRAAGRRMPGDPRPLQPPGFPGGRPPMGLYGPTGSVNPLGAGLTVTRTQVSAGAIDPLTGLPSQALDDPMLANVAIDGWVVILNPPPPLQEPDPTAVGPEPSADQAPADTAALPEGAAGALENGASEGRPATDEPREPAGDNPGDTPAAIDRKEPDPPDAAP